MNIKLLDQIVHAELTRDARIQLKLLAIMEQKSAKQYLIDLIKKTYEKYMENRKRSKTV